MKKFLSILFLSLLMIRCHSQKIISKESTKSKVDYFIGSWKFVQKNYKDGSETKIYPLHECMKEYELIFKKENQKTIMAKTFATGKDCKIKSRSDDFSVTISESSIFYTEYDLKKNEQYKIYSDNKFSIIYNDIIDGKVTEIEDIYQRK
ncbi:lipocalin family protein [Chryseobacterium sp. PBS4-4]|uniref:Lipocalin family protein n=1 Tax=Chryseobacterium edaphi TaxID=2976532 RepID=A0ABT2W849_9FLAO|nr:lipocalin family protein [Chryseobacterium edaphi]MCU7618385.1 lipocalin family protein [Chryseobacterium edaphi]